jgi:hypothetical protein
MMIFDFTMSQFKFVGRISTQGKNLIIWIPREFHKDVKPLRDKQIKILLDDTI